MSHTKQIVSFIEVIDTHTREIEEMRWKERGGEREREGERRRERERERESLRGGEKEKCTRNE